MSRHNHSNSSNPENMPKLETGAQASESLRIRALSVRHFARHPYASLFGSFSTGSPLVHEL